MYKSLKFGKYLQVAALCLFVAVAAHFGWAQAHPELAVLGFAGITMPNAGVRVIDPILSNVAQGYKNGELVGSYLFPRVPVFATGGQVIEFGKEAFYQYNLRRTPGGARKRIQFGYLGKPFALMQDAFSTQVPREWMRDASNVPGIDLGQRSIALGMKIATKSLEIDQAALATNAANYDNNHKLALSGATLWSASTGTPSDDIDAGREAVRASVGLYPNVVLMSANAFKAARNNPNVKSRFQYTTHDSITTDMLANLWNVEKVVVGAAITMTDQGAASDIWGNSVVLACTNLGSLNAEEPSYGYTYTMDGHPLVEQPYWDEDTSSWVYPVTFERVPVLSGITSGFLIPSVV